MNARTLLALLLSYIFHPVLLLVFSALWEARGGTAAEWVLITGTLFFVPLLLLLILRKLEKISSYHLPLRSERDLVYSLQLLWFGLVLAGMANWKMIPPQPLSRLLLAVIGIGFLSFANRFVNKASAHMAVVAALGGVYTWEAGTGFLWFCLPAGALVWFARSSLKAHTGWELLAGLICGLSSCLCWIWLV